MTKDFENFKATPEQWRNVEQWSDGGSTDSCILELRSRMGRLEAYEREDANSWGAVRESMHNLREHFEALKKRVEELQPTVKESSEPIATDDGLLRCYSQAVTDSIQRGATNQELSVAARRAIYDLGRHHAHIQAARVECLRRALIGVITVCGGIASEDVSDDFLCKAPDEVLACLKKPRYRYSPVTIAECGGPCEQGPEHCDCGEIKPESEYTDAEWAEIQRWKRIDDTTPSPTLPLMKRLGEVWSEGKRLHPYAIRAVIREQAAWLRERGHASAASAIEREVE